MQSEKRLAGTVPSPWACRRRRERGKKGKGRERKKRSFLGTGHGAHRCPWGTPETSGGSLGPGGCAPQCAETCPPERTCGDVRWPASRDIELPTQYSIAHTVWTWCDGYFFFSVFILFCGLSPGWTKSQQQLRCITWLIVLEVRWCDAWQLRSLVHNVICLIVAWHAQRRLHDLVNG